MRQWWARLVQEIRRRRRLRARYVLDAIRPDADEIDAAIRAAFNECGARLDGYAPDFDLGSKWHEVLIHAGRKLGYRMHTVEDVREWLR